MARKPETWGDRLRHALMGLIAGDRFAYWIKDSAADQIEELNSVAGGGAAIVLVETVKKNGADSATFTLDELLPHSFGPDHLSLP